jgi:hypothetical protein
MSRPPRPSREQLRQQFLHQAAQAFDLMFADGEDLVTFDQRERRADDLGQTLALQLLQGHAATDPAADPSPDQVVVCPHCQRPAQRQDDPDQLLPDRALTIASGQRVLLRRARFRCPACRVVFFPPG